MTQRAMNPRAKRADAAFTASESAGRNAARWLSPGDRGLFAVVMTFVLIADYQTQLGLRLAVIYRIGRAGSPTARAVAASVELSLAAFAITAAVAIVGSDWLRARFLSGAPDSRGSRWC
jgi:O-antigen/teichoic acid export membrane protein